MKNMSVLCPQEFKRECVMAFDLLTFWDKNQMLKLDIGELEECEDVACGWGTYRSDSSISSEKCSRLSNKLSNVSL